jgi:hypothetical protein
MQKLRKTEVIESQQEEKLERVHFNPSLKEGIRVTRSIAVALL